MRIHRLEIQAFGPFVQRQVVDFDRLGEQGLFLLEGATGAGKSSVLDAICFALFASVPGVRQSGQRLRSDHAPADLAPEVLLEFSIPGRQFRILRSPAWLRPAKRGSSTVRENAQALLSEKLDGAWVALSSRNDEAAHQIQALLGMNREQFTKVVMLAQGEFAAFLRADIKERQLLLQQLFGTGRFRSLEQKLLESASSAQDGVQSAQQQLAEILHAARLQAEEFLPGSLEAAQDGPTPNPDAGPGDFEHLLGVLAERQAELSTASEQAAEAVARAAAELVAAENLAARHAELAAAEAAAELVQAGEADQLARVRMLEQHRVAQDLSPDLDRLQAAEAADELARQDQAAAQRKLEDRGSWLAGADAPAGQGPTATSLEEEAKALAASAAVVRSLLREEAQLLRQQREAEQAAAEVEAAGKRLSAAEELGDSLLAERDALIEQRSSVSADAGLLESRKSAAQRAKAEADAGEGFRGTEIRLRALDLELRAAESGQLASKAGWLALMQARLERAAGELAAGLAEGDPCPVCGATEHPAPSDLKGTSLQLVAEEERAREDHERRESDVAVIRDSANQAATELAAFAALGGDRDADQLAAAVAQSAAQAQESESAQQQLLQYGAELADLEPRLEAALAAAAEARAQIQEQRAACASLQRAIGERQSKVAAWLAGHQSLASRLAELAQDESLLSAALGTRRSAETAAAELAAAESAMARKLAGSPFGSVSEIAAALQQDEVLAEAVAANAAFQDAAIRVRQRLDAEPVRQAETERANGISALGPEVLQELRSAVQTATMQAGRAGLQHQLCGRSLAAVQRAAARYAELEQQTAPERARAELLTGLAETARGLGHNEFKMPLSAYVLAARLEQVAEAASERLQVMSDGRYLLAHTDALAGGNKKSGLGLEVVDGWTGQSRDTSTLSGGESFMASLALALGLADVVQRESGGMRIDTLFVDEGFGSLDEESLEMVMASIEGLRDSGRTVGLVSHVAELKLRIPQQLHVVKGRQGSTLRAQTSDRLE